VDRFDLATSTLLAEGWITAVEPPDTVFLASGRTVGGVVRRLVELGIEVEGITREEATLESFYLELVKTARLQQPAAGGRPPTLPPVQKP